MDLPFVAFYSKQHCLVARRPFWDRHSYEAAMRHSGKSSPLKREFGDLPGKVDALPEKADRSGFLTPAVSLECRVALPPTPKYITMRCFSPRLIGRLGIAVSCIVTQLSAQSTVRNADNDWTAIVQLTAGPVPATPGTKRSRDEHAARHAQQVAAARSAAQAAKDFYTRYPADTRAAEARKIEALSALRGVDTDDPAQEAAAIAVARAFREDFGRSLKDRFDVAVAMDTQELNIKRKAGLVANVAAEQKKLVERWRAEFGGIPEVETYAVSLARLADPQNASAMASQIARSPRATARVKKEATAITERATLLGKGVDLKIPLLGGGNVDLKEQQGHVTIVVVWSPARPESLQPLSVFQKALPRGAQIVCLALGGTTGDVMRVRHTLPAVSYFSHLPLGPAANQVAGALKLQLAPYVYVLNRSGVLSDFGPLVELPALLTRAGVTTIKQSS